MSNNKALENQVELDKMTLENIGNEHKIDLKNLDDQHQLTLASPNAIDPLEMILQGEHLSYYKIVNEEIVRFKNDVAASFDMVIDFLVQYSHCEVSQFEGKRLYLQICLKSEMQMMWLLQQRRNCLNQQLKEINGGAGKTDILYGIAYFESSNPIGPFDIKNAVINKLNSFVANYAAHQKFLNRYYPS